MLYKWFTNPSFVYHLVYVEGFTPSGNFKLYVDIEVLFICSFKSQVIDYNKGQAMFFEKPMKAKTKLDLEKKISDLIFHLYYTLFYT